MIFEHSSEKTEYFNNEVIDEVFAEKAVMKNQQDDSDQNLRSQFLTTSMKVYPYCILIKKKVFAKIFTGLAARMAFMLMTLVHFGMKPTLI